MVRNTMPGTAPSHGLKQGSRCGTDSTHWLSGRQEDRTVTSATVSAMRRMVHEGHTHRPSQEKATSIGLAT